MDGRWAGGGTRPAYGEDFFRAASAALSSEKHNPARRAAVAVALWLGSSSGGGPRQAQGASQASRSPPPTKHAASLGEGHRANSMTAEEDDLMAETLEGGVRRRGLSSSCIVARCVTFGKAFHPPVSLPTHHMPSLFSC